MNIELLLNDNDFNQFVEKTDPDEFTFYDVLDMAHYEIRHSNTIAWLFDSKAIHNLKNLFLRKFIETLYNYKNNREKLDSIIKIDEKGILLKKTNCYIDFNYTEFEIRREWKHIDIFVLSEELKFLITIENKPGTEDPGQLSSYKNDVIDKDYKDEVYTRIFIFLTLDGTPPEEQEDKIYWLPFDYGQIVKIIDQYILSEESIKCINNFRVEDFIRQYSYNIKKNFINYYDLTNHASVLYNKHKTIFDSLIEIKNSNGLNDLLNKYNLNRRIQDSINYIIHSQSNIEFKILKQLAENIKSKAISIIHHPQEGQKWLSITPHELKSITENKGYKYTFFIAFEPKTISIEFYAEADFSKNILKRIESSNIFNIYRSDHYSVRIYQKNILTEDDYYQKTFEELLKTYESAINSFFEDEAKIIYNEISLLL